MTETLVHICPTGDWDGTAPSYVPPTFAADGFIHLSRPDQVRRPADRFYTGRTDLLLLVIDGSAVSDRLRWEPSVVPEEQGELFPHLYAPLPVAAVVDVVDYHPGSDGRFGEPQL